MPNGPRSLTEDAFYRDEWPLVPPLLPNPRGVQFNRFTLVVPGVPPFSTDVIEPMSKLVHLPNPLNPLVTTGLAQAEDIPAAFQSDMQDYNIFVPPLVAATLTAAPSAAVKVTLLFAVWSEFNRHGLRTFFAPKSDRVLITISGREAAGGVKAWGVGITDAQIRQLFASAGFSSATIEVDIIAGYSTGYRGVNGTINNALIGLGNMKRIIFLDALYRGDDPLPGGNTARMLQQARAANPSVELIVYEVTPGGTPRTGGNTAVNLPATAKFIDLKSQLGALTALIFARVSDNGISDGYFSPAAVPLPVQQLSSDLPPRGTLASSGLTQGGASNGTLASWASARAPLIAGALAQAASLTALFTQSANVLTGWAFRDTGSMCHDGFMPEFGWGIPCGIAPTTRAIHFESCSETRVMPMIARNFLDFPCSGGVNAALDAKLTIADNLLRAAYAAEHTAGLFQGSFTEWAEIRQNHGAAHPGGHAPGDAIDVNYETNPYIAIRTPSGNRVIFGGEAPEPPGIRMARVRATTVYDRAIAFFSIATNVANVSARSSTESTTDVYRRFKAASDALRDYLRLVFLPTIPTTIINPPPPQGNNPPHVDRAPLANAHGASLTQLLSAIPQSERLPDATARANIATFTSRLQFLVDHPGWDASVEFWYRQILRDYEVVRIPMQFGAPSLRPSSTRNPANGFLNLREEVVVTLGGDPAVVLINPLMRWGVCDFGPTASGDVQHFDLRSRIPSGVAGSSPPEVRIRLETVAGIQQALSALNFDAGDISDVTSAATVAAIGAFRATYGLPPGGMDGGLQVALDLALRQAAVPF